MIRMKDRIGSCLAAAAMLFTLAACSQQTAQQPTEEPSLSPAAQTPAASPEPPQETGSPAPESSADSAAGGGTLVVYFSATGNTEAVADTLRTLWARTSLPSLRRNPIRTMT